MTIRTIALVLFDRAEAEWLVPLACETARAFDAHLIGVHPHRPVPVYFGPEGDLGFMEAVRELRVAEVAEIEDLFSDTARRADIHAELRAQPEASLASEAYMLSAVRGADLVVMASTGSEGPMSGNDGLARTLIRQAGRPVLVLPQGAGLAGAPERILVGWSDTREAARAAHDVLALAKPGAEIDLLSIGEPDGPVDGREDFAAALDRLGFQATLVDREASLRERGETLLAVAEERGAQLVVSGAFGHSQFYDFVIGAVTNHLLEHTKLPVLLSK
ncbi:universal stress protein [Tropicimonas isoalkanivorans]|uniref:Universal stress protein family protein n=1 Tax=Tropicimonas isoalkanivorans TaxID=441112 RepID=A0A1I1E6L0_9RHOB|nr:universal stress protein [Tropicimonas isoalkanivorans]SFB82767.1 Universal stress protein family protein [Tropicimonas isoalkanivorans]